LDEHGYEADEGARPPEPVDWPDIGPYSRNEQGIMKRRFTFPARHLAR